MNVLLISRCPPYPLHLGDRLIVYHLARELAAFGHTIDLLAFADRPDDWVQQPHYEQFFRHVELLPEPERAPMDYLQRQLLPARRFPRAASGAWSPAMWQAIEARLATERYDLAHLFGGVHVYEYARALGERPAIITPYESYSLYLRRALAAANGPANRLKTFAQWRLAQAFERWMFAPYRRAVVVTEQDRAELKRLNSSLPVEVIPNGVDLAEFQPGEGERLERTLLFTGNYEYAPNVDAALRLATDILPRVQAQFPDTRLWLVGNAPPPELRALAGSHVEVTGRVPDVRPWLAQATAFVSPLRLGAGIKNKVLEALAMGCPVVATPLSVDGIAVEDGCHALVAGDDRLAPAVIRLLQNRDLRYTLSRQGRLLIETRYSWARVARAYERLYTEVAR